MTAGAILWNTAKRTRPADLEWLLGRCVASGVLDADGSDETAAGSDGLVVLRYLLGLRGAALNDVIDPAGSRNTVAEVEAYLQGLLP